MANFAPFTGLVLAAHDAPAYVVISGVDMGGFYLGESLGYGASLAAARAESLSRCLVAPVAERVLRDSGKRVTRRKIKMAVYEIVG